MYSCSALKNPSFIGLSSLVRVDRDWMRACKALADPSFTGLSSLRRIGSVWMVGCDALANPNFTGLSSLTRVGSHASISVQRYFNLIQSGDRSSAAYVCPVL